VLIHTILSGTVALRWVDRSDLGRHSAYQLICNHILPARCEGSNSTRTRLWRHYSEAVAARVALATCATYPSGEEVEGDLLLDACRAAGLDAEYRDWAEPGLDWADYDLVVIRSTWDYVPRRAEFEAWAASVPRLANPASIVSWNANKTYIAVLADAGVPVVDTRFVEPGQQPQFPQATEFVVKPAEGAGSMGAGRFTAADDGARRHVEALHRAGRTVMLQPYLADVDTAGETALIFFDGVYSHAIRKGPMLPESHVYPLDATEDELFVAEEITPRTPSAAEHDLARAALAAVPGGERLLYARVDLLPTPAGPVVGELELIEPSLFLAYNAGAPLRLAAAIAARAQQ
jgi:glutathione synthase/RimK-type ligase-like ATP-grasp enzyme